MSSELKIMREFDFIIVALIWILGIVSLISGKIFTPKFKVNRKDNPDLYWKSFFIMLAVAVLVTILTVRSWN